MLLARGTDPMSAYCRPPWRRWRRAGLKQSGLGSCGGPGCSLASSGPRGRRTVSGGKVDAQARGWPTAGTAGAPFFRSKTPPLLDASSMISVAGPLRRNPSLKGTRDVPLVT